MQVIARMNVGGPAVLVASLMRNLPDLGLEQRLVTGFCDPTEEDFLESQAAAVPVTRLRGLGRNIQPTDDVRALWGLIQEIRQFRPDIVNTHTTKAGVLGRVAARLSGTDPLLVHTFHGHLLHGYFSPSRTRKLVALEKVLARSTAQLVAVGDRVRDDLLAAGIGDESQFRVVSPGLTLISPPTRDEARRILKLPSQATVIGYVGRLTQIKRPDRFVEVVKLASRNSAEVHFVVAGSGDLADMTQQLTQHLPVTMLGWRDDVHVVLGACDAMILTSDNEGTPLSVIQAGMAGLPVIACDVGSVRDVVIDGKTGWLTKPSAQALSSALMDFLANPQEGARRGAAARSHTEAMFNEHRWVVDHANMYRSLLEQQGKLEQ